MSNLKMDDSSWEIVSNAVDGIRQQWAVKEESGTVKFLKFDPGKAYPKHHHPDRIEWLYVISGEMNAQIDDQLYRLKEGEFAVFPLNSKHSLEAGKNGAIVMVVALSKS